jgi:hypothetical protein
MDSLEVCRERLQKVFEAIWTAARREHLSLLLFGIDDDGRS